MKTQKIILLLFVGFLTLSSLYFIKSSDEEWGSSGHDVSNNKFSELKNINTTNVSQLKEVWHFEDTREGSSVLFNPIIKKGRMIALLPSSKLAALNPENGKLLWEFTPDSTVVDTWSKAATYHEGVNGKPDVVLFIFGSTLYSINAENGELIKEFGKNGRVDFYEGLSISKSMRSKVHVTYNGGGVVHDNLFIVGCKVPDELPSTAGDIRAFDVNTGKLAWVFHTIPQKGEFGADTWAANARIKNGGANCWTGMALDEKRGIVYVPTASPSFDFYGADRPGMNLFANCLLALDAKTGKRIWHFQTTHHDLWDRDNGSPPNLITVNHEGKRVDAVALVTKMGYLFLFDRVTGKSLFPIKEVPVLTKSTMPNEKPWPTQPIPTKPAPFVRQGYKEEYFSTINPEVNQLIKDQIKENKYSTGVYEPPSLNGSIILPTAHGGANWGGAAVNPATGVLFVNAIDIPWFLKLKELKKLKENNTLSGEKLFKMNCSSCHGANKKGTTAGPNISSKIDTYTAERIEKVIKNGSGTMPSFKTLPQEQITSIVSYLKNQTSATTVHKVVEKDENTEPYGFSGYDFYQDTSGVPFIKPPFGTLNAIDLNSGESLWQVPLGEDPRLAKMGIKDSGLFNRGGAIATAGGLVFIAASVDKTFRAFDQKTGKVVWKTTLPGNGTAIPSTYSINGKQYVTIAVSPDVNYKGGYITFSLN